MAKIELEIKNCMQCPNFDRKRIYTADSWEEGYDWMCKANHDKVIAGFVEWNDVGSIPIPQWCPILVKN